MDDMVLTVERVARLGCESLGRLHVTPSFASEEAGVGRGLLINSCRRDALLRHIVYAALNSLPAKTVIVPSSYDLLETVAEMLTDEGAEFWLWPRDGRPRASAADARIQIAVPERLYTIEKHVVSEGFRPSYIYVADPLGHLQTASRRPYGSISERGDNVARFKATCEATGAVPYVVALTCREPAAMWTHEPARMFGVEAMYYGNGQTLRTAAFRTPSAVFEYAEPQETHELQPWVHEAVLRRPSALLVLETQKYSAEQTVAVLAKSHGYPCLAVDGQLATAGKCVDGNGDGARLRVDMGKAIARGVMHLNRQVTVLTGTRDLWNASDDLGVLILLAPSAMLSTLVVPAPGGPRKDSLLAAASQINASRDIRLHVFAAFAEGEPTV